MWVLQFVHYQSTGQANPYHARDDQEEVDEAVPEEKVGN
jgi:hypothetical protein